MEVTQLVAELEDVAQYSNLYLLQSSNSQLISKVLTLTHSSSTLNGWSRSRIKSNEIYHYAWDTVRMSSILVHVIESYDVPNK